MTPAASPRPGPLAGIKVLDFGHMVMGPSCGLILADLGAEVMRIEPPGGDPTRRLRGLGMGFFTNFNRNKSSAQIDLKQGDASREVLDRALRWADVAIENFAPGVMKNLGLDYEAVRAINPRIVYCSLKGFLPGPYQDRLALDEVAQMMGGMAFMTGPEGQPLRAGGSIVDITGGMFGAIGILAALREREHTGSGQLVQSALYETAAFYSGQHMAYYALSGQAPRPMPSRDHLFTVYDLFRTRDNDVFVAVTSEQHWQRFCEEFGLAELFADPAHATQADRLKVRGPLTQSIADVFATLGSDEIVERCARARLPVAKVNRPEQLMDDQHLRESGQLLPTRLPDGREVPLPALPFRMDGRTLGIVRQPQPAGAQTRDFLTALGYGAEEIESLADAGVFPDTASTFPIAAPVGV
jgi:crotonobetainyl-CoA:carnitine CoA-transferase CaiB-like acyl-CoA transferase